MLADRERLPGRRRADLRPRRGRGDRVGDACGAGLPVGAGRRDHIGEGPRLGGVERARRRARAVGVRARGQARAAGPLATGKARRDVLADGERLPGRRRADLCRGRRGDRVGDACGAGLPVGAGRRDHIGEGPRLGGVERARRRARAVGVRARGQARAAGPLATGKARRDVLADRERLPGRRRADLCRGRRGDRVGDACGAGLPVAAGSRDRIGERPRLRRIKRPRRGAGAIGVRTRRQPRPARPLGARETRPDLVTDRERRTIRRRTDLRRRRGRHGVMSSAARGVVRVVGRGHGERVLAGGRGVNRAPRYDRPRA